MCFFVLNMSIITLMDIQKTSDRGILEALGSRLRGVRLDANLTREALASQTGLSVDTVRNAETGRNISVETLVRMLRGLGHLDDLASLVEDAVLSPVQLARTQGRIRQRASGRRRNDDDDDDDDGWQW